MRISGTVTLQDVWTAAKRIKPYIDETPLWHSPALGKSVYLKMENFHENGSFKIRGAANKILSLSEAEKRKGVTTFSTGNHGLAVAYLGKRLGIRAVICISNRVPAAKVKRLERLGAEVIKVGNNQDDAEIYADKLQSEQGLTVIHPFDDPHIIAGQGTIGLELIQAMPDLQVAVIPVSGGGLFAGISFVLKKYNPDIRIIGVSMAHSAVMYESIQAKQVITMQETDTYADSLLGGIGKDNQFTFQMVKDHIDEFILLTEDEIAHAMAMIFDEHQCAVEGASATSAGAIISEKAVIGDEKVVCIMTGRNVDASVILKVCEDRL